MRIIMPSCTSKKGFAVTANLSLRCIFIIIPRKEFASLTILFFLLEMQEVGNK